MPFTNEQAYEYAAQWGSMVTNGDPGACMYGFSEDFTVQSESHRADCIAWMQDCRKDVESNPANYDGDELEKIDMLIAKLTIAHLSGATPYDALDTWGQHYGLAVLFTGVMGVDPDESEGVYDLDPANFSADACNDIAAEVADFKAKAADLIPLAIAAGHDEEHLAHDLWLTRNGHGAGFWDRQELAFIPEGYDKELGDLLSDIARAMGESDAYIGDDGFIYFM